MLAAFAFILVPQLEKIATVSHESVTEMSGIIQSQQHKGIYWVQNDSGDSARIFPIRLDGSVVKTANAKNWDG
ncbi:MAG: hypothetical protein ABL962_03370, partial [Fimbriimonadaceae bacterium]